jgi:CBS domain-containing protein
VSELDFSVATGFAVLDADGRPVGVISERDIVSSVSPQATVAELMSRPAVMIAERAPVAFAAGLMLQNGIHRLVVVDGHGCATGVLSRTDIFQPRPSDFDASDSDVKKMLAQVAADRDRRAHQKE